MEIKKTVSNARRSFFLFAALAFIGLGIYSMGYKVPGVAVLAVGIGGFMISMSIIKFSFRVQGSIEAKERRQKTKRK